MASPPHLDPKLSALQAYGAVHPHPEAVSDPLFATGDFFDARDLVQVRYEMVRRAQVDRQPITHVATVFGVSRPTVYGTLATLQAGGLPALLPRRRGPHGRYKLRAEIVAFITEARASKEVIPIPRLVDEVQERFGVLVHRRSIERVARPVKGGAVPTT
jgi:transposase